MVKTIKLTKMEMQYPDNWLASWNRIYNVAVKEKNSTVIATAGEKIRLLKEYMASDNISIWDVTDMHHHGDMDTDAVLSVFKAFKNKNVLAVWHVLNESGENEQYIVALYDHLRNEQQVKQLILKHYDTTEDEFGVMTLQQLI